MTHLATYGAAVASLDAFLQASHREKAAPSFGTPEYLQVCILTAHCAFVRWCVAQELANPAAVRKALQEHVRNYRQPVGQPMRYLFEVIPAEFNVRGEWTLP